MVQVKHKEKIIKLTVSACRVETNKLTDQLAVEELI